MMLERQREGVTRAKAEGNYRGRKPTVRAKVDEVRRLHAEEKTVSEVAKAFGDRQGECLSGFGGWR